MPVMSENAINKPTMISPVFEKRILTNGITRLGLNPPRPELDPGLPHRSSIFELCRLPFHFIIKIGYLVQNSRFYLAIPRFFLVER